MHPFYKASDIAFAKFRFEARPTFFEPRKLVLGNTNGLSPEVVVVTGYKHKLLVSVKRTTGTLVVSLALLVRSVFSLQIGRASCRERV